MPISEYDPRDYQSLLEPILEGHADVVFGNRFHGGPHRVLYFWHYVGNRLLTLATNVVTGLNLSDMEVGYKVFRADVPRRLTLTSNRFGLLSQSGLRPTLRSQPSSGWAGGQRAYDIKILRGAKPADLPVDQAAKLEFTINLKTAKVLSLTIPPSILGRADQVIE